RAAVGPDGTLFDGRVVTDGLFAVHACRGHKPPATAYVAVKYRDYWYYVDDRDHASKATFALVLQLSRLDFGRQQPGAPLLTLPVGRGAAGRLSLSRGTGRRSSCAGGSAAAG